MPSWLSGERPPSLAPAIEDAEVHLHLELVVRIEPRLQRREIGKRLRRIEVAPHDPASGVTALHDDVARRAALELRKERGPPRRGRPVTHQGEGDEEAGRALPAGEEIEERVEAP